MARCVEDRKKRNRRVERRVVRRERFASSRSEAGAESAIGRYLAVCTSTQPVQVCWAAVVVDTHTRTHAHAHHTQAVGSVWSSSWALQGACCVSLGTRTP